MIIPIHYISLAFFSILLGIFIYSAVIAYLTLRLPSPTTMSSSSVQSKSSKLNSTLPQRSAMNLAPPIPTPTPTPREHTSPKFKSPTINKEKEKEKEKEFEQNKTQDGKSVREIVEDLDVAYRAFKQTPPLIEQQSVAILQKTDECMTTIHQANIQRAEQYSKEMGQIYQQRIQMEKEYIKELHLIHTEALQKQREHQIHIQNERKRKLKDIEEETQESKPKIQRTNIIPKAKSPSVGPSTPMQMQTQRTSSVSSTALTEVDHDEMDDIHFSNIS